MKFKFMSLMAVAITVFSFMSCGGAKKVAQGRDVESTTTNEATKPSTTINAEAIVQPPVTQPVSVAQEWRKDGFSSTGATSTFTLEEMLYRHNTKIMEDVDKYIPVLGTAEARDLSTARLFALNDASIQYATKAQSVLSGEIARLTGNLKEDSKTKIAAVYLQKVNQFVMPYMKESVAASKKEDNIVYVKTFFIIDEENAKAARKNAIDETLKEVALEETFIESVRQMVDKTVKPTE